MDKKNLILGVGCIVIAFGLMIHQSSQMREEYVRQEQSKAAQVIDGSVRVEVNSSNDKSSILADETIGVELNKSIQSDIDHNDTLLQNPKIIAIENENLVLKISDIGAGIDNVILKKHKAENTENSTPYIVNENRNIPLFTLAFSDYKRQLFSRYTLKEKSKSRVVFEKIMKNGVAIQRIYSIDDSNLDYVVNHSIKFINHTQKDFDLGNLYLELGGYPATSSDPMGEFLNFGYFDGKKTHFIAVNEFKASSGFFGLGKREARNSIDGNDKIVWGSVKNQFFTTIFTPLNHGNGFVCYPTEVKDNKTQQNIESVIGAIRMSVGHLHAGETKEIKGSIYIGPKDYVLLDKLGGEQDRVMQFGFFGFVSKFLLLIMRGIHAIIPSWGLTIIILTVLVKLILWPLTTAQVRSSRKMMKIQEPMKKLREKYSNNPQKLQSEVLKLFRDHKVNPAAGFLPLFVQIPIFLGLYFMLRTTADMRFMSFLWIKDLALPDTIASIGGFNLNLLPLLMGATMIWQMNVMPNPSAEGAQKFIIKVMPFVFLFICYRFPAALVLYWTVQNLLTIAQQIILKNKDDKELLIEEDINPKRKKGRRK